MSRKDRFPVERTGDESSLRPDRRLFVKTVVIGGLTWTGLGLAASGQKPRFGRILADYGKCTGCRTCETVCAQVNQKTEVEGTELWGLGNPNLSCIRVYHFNPDVDVPSVCLMCEDNPCIEACPVDPDGQGRRALFRNPKTGAVQCDTERCLACGHCAKACRKERVGAIVPDPKSGHPQRLCTLCDGDPQCVKYCPFGTLEYQTGPLDDTSRAKAAEKIAQGLTLDWYGQEGKGGGSDE